MDDNDIVDAQTHDWTPSIAPIEADPAPERESERTDLQQLAAAFDKAIESIGSAITSRLDQILDTLIERLPERVKPEPKIQQLVGWNEAGEKARAAAEEERIADERADLISPSGAKPFDPRIGFMRRLDAILFPDSSTKYSRRVDDYLVLVQDVSAYLRSDEAQR